MKNNRFTRLAKKALESDIFKKAQKEAQSYTTDSKKMDELLGNAEAKSEKVEAGKLNVFAKFKTLVRMLKAFRNGAYKVIPWQSVIFITAGIIYFVSPLDFLPDFIPFLGFTDDISVLLFIFNSLTPDIEKFLAWEKETELSLAEVVE